MATTVMQLRNGMGKRRNQRALQTAANTISKREEFIEKYLGALRERQRIEKQSENHDRGIKHQDFLQEKPDKNSVYSSKTLKYKRSKKLGNISTKVKHVLRQGDEFQAKNRAHLHVLPEEKDRNDIINFVQDDLTAVELREKRRFTDPSNCPLEEIDNAISDDSIPYCSAGSKFAEENPSEFGSSGLLSPCGDHDEEVDVKEDIVGAPPNTPGNGISEQNPGRDEILKKDDLIFSGKRKRPPKPRYKLRLMYNKYTEAMRSGSPTRRVYAQGIRRRKLKYLSPLSKPVYLSNDAFSKPIKLNRKGLKPLPSISRSEDYLGNHKCRNKYYTTGNVNDPDSMDNEMLVDEYLSQSSPSLRAVDHAGIERSNNNLKHYVPYRLIGTDMECSDVPAKCIPQSFTSFAERVVGNKTMISTSNEIQLDVSRIAMEKRYLGQKRHRDTWEDGGDNGLARDIKLLSISTNHQDDIYKTHKRLNKGPQTKVKEAVKEIQIFIPTAEREESFCSDISSHERGGEENGIGKRKTRINHSQRKRLQSLEETTNYLKQRHEDILLGSDFPRERDKMKVSCSSLGFISSPTIKEEEISVSLNQLDDIITRNKLPKLKYQTVTTQSQNGFPKLDSGELGYARRDLFSPDSKLQVPNFFVSDFDSNSNSNNSNGFLDANENHGEFIFSFKKKNASENEFSRSSMVLTEEHGGQLKIPEIRMITATPRESDSED